MTNGKPAAPICRDCFERVVNVLRNLTQSAQGVVNNWESGDLAGAVNVLDADSDAAQAMLNAIDASGMGGSHAHH